MKRIVGLVLMLMMAQGSSWAEMLVYVSVSGEKRIAIYRLDEKTGGLEVAGSLDVDGAVGPIWEHPSRPEFFAALRSTGKLATLDVDRRDGHAHGRA